MEVVGVEEMKVKGYPNLKTGEWMVKVKESGDRKLPCFMKRFRKSNKGMYDNCCQLVWWGQGEFGCYVCGEGGHIGRLCGRERRWRGR